MIVCGSDMHAAAGRQYQAYCDDGVASGQLEVYDTAKFAVSGAVPSSRVHDTELKQRWHRQMLAACPYTCGKCPPSAATGMRCGNLVYLLSRLSSLDISLGNLWKKLVSKSAFKNGQEALYTIQNTIVPTRGFINSSPGMTPTYPSQTSSGESKPTAQLWSSVTLLNTMLLVSMVWIMISGVAMLATGGEVLKKVASSNCSPSTLFRPTLLCVESTSGELLTVLLACSMLFSGFTYDLRRINEGTVPEHELDWVSRVMCLRAILQVFSCPPLAVGECVSILQAGVLFSESCIPTATCYPEVTPRAVSAVPPLMGAPLQWFYIDMISGDAGLVWFALLPRLSYIGAVGGKPGHFK